MFVINCLSMSMSECKSIEVYNDWALNDGGNVFAVVFVAFAEAAINNWKMSNAYMDISGPLYFVKNLSPNKNANNHLTLSKKCNIFLPGLNNIL